MKALRGYSLTGLRSDGGQMTALFADRRKSVTTTVRVARLRAGKLTPTGPPLNEQGQVLSNLGLFTANARSTVVDVALAKIGPGEETKRSLATLTRSGWSKSTLPNLTIGSQLSGPVRTKGRVFFPANNMGTGDRPRQPMVMSVFGTEGTDWYQVGGRPVSGRQGASQGGIDPVGNRVWVSWTRATTGKKRISGGSNHAARINPQGTGFDRKVTLSKGKPIGPGSNQTVEYQGKPAFLYMKNVDDRTRAAVTLGAG